METQFVPFELAVKLKELGFNEQSLGSYIQYEYYSFECDRSGKTISINEGSPIKLYIGRYVNDFGRPERKICSAPIWQQAFEYFLNFKGMHGSVLYSYNCFFYYTISFIGGKNNNIISYDENNINGARYACIEKLIELCK